jgi:hypothetical protein
MKYRAGGTRGTRQGWRFLASTIVGEAVDTVVFVTVAYLGTLPPVEIARMIATLYVVKVLYEAAALPVTVRFSNWVKKVEGVDWIDRPAQTRYNPFAILRSR